MAGNFQGFPAEGFAFLRGLAAEQNRAWFEANKATYENDLRWPMTALVADLTSAFAQRGIPLQGDPKRSVFRIHRDVRFAKDKAPYKTNVGATLTRNGSKMGPGLLYVHVEPGRCFMGAGFYHPEPEHLTALRHAIADEPEAFRGMVAELAERGLHIDPDAEALKRTPRGFEHVTGADLLQAVRRKSFLIRQKLTDAAMGSAALVDTIVTFAEQALPLLSYGWTVLTHDGVPVASDIGHPENPEAKKRAHLLAAAPELRSALEAMEQAYSNKHSQQHRAACLAEARAALAKALGEPGA
jgi:uncharacterized protein (TIGR02453 family)